MKFYRSHFGRKLRRALEVSGKTQRQLAEDPRIDVNQSAVSKWVTGEDMPSEERLPAICAVLKVPEDYFDVDQPDFQLASDFLSKLAGSPHDIQKLVLSIVHKDPGHLKTASRDFRQKAIDFLKAVQAL